MLYLKCKDSIFIAYKFPLLAQSWVVYILLSWHSLRRNTMGLYKISNYGHTTKRIKVKKTQILGGSEAISNLSLPISPEKCFLSSKYSFSHTSEFTGCPSKGFKERMETSFSLLPPRFAFQGKLMTVHLWRTSQFYKHILSYYLIWLSHKRGKV